MKRTTPTFWLTIALLFSFVLSACGSKTPPSPSTTTTPAIPATEVTFLTTRYGAVTIKLTLPVDSNISLDFFVEDPKMDPPTDQEYAVKWDHLVHIDNLPYKQGPVELSGHWFVSSEIVQTKVKIHIAATNESFELLSIGGGEIPEIGSYASPLRLLCGSSWVAEVKRDNDPGSPLGMAIYVDGIGKPIITFADGDGFRSLHTTKPDLKASIIELDRDTHRDHAESVYCNP